MQIKTSYYSLHSTRIPNLKSVITTKKSIVTKKQKTKQKQKHKLSLFIPSSFLSSFFLFHNLLSFNLPFHPHVLSATYFSGFYFSNSKGKKIPSFHVFLWKLLVFCCCYCCFVLFCLEQLKSCDSFWLSLWPWPGMMY